MTSETPSLSEDDILEQFNNGDLTKEDAIQALKKLTDEVWVYCVDTEEIKEECGTYKCQVSGNYYASDEDFITCHVIRRPITQTVYCHENSVDSFYDENLQEYFSNDVFSSVRVDGDTICEEYHQDEIYFWERDDEYHWQPEPEDEDDSIIPEYHTQPRHYQPQGEVFGLEIEVEAKDEDNLESIRNLCDKAGIICERDGSLDDILGVELVFPPLKYDDMAGFSEFISKMAKLADGWNAGDGYGMHISLNLPNYTFLQVSRATIWMDEHKAICERIAGRRENSWCNYVKKTPVQVEKESKGGDYHKYEALAVRSASRLECRIFRSTLAFDGVLRNVQFLKTLFEYCSCPRKSSFVSFVKRNYKNYTQLLEKLTITPPTKAAKL